MNLQSPDPSSAAPSDRIVTAVCMTFTALCVGFAVDVNFGDYRPDALLWLTIGFGFCIIAVAVGRIGIVEWLCSWGLTALLALAVIAQPIVLLYELHISQVDPNNLFVRDYLKEVQSGLVLILILGVLQAFDLRSMRVPLLAIMLIAFAMIASVEFNNLRKDPRIDVLVFQQRGSQVLLHGKNPYDPNVVEFPNLYEHDTPFYGPGVVGDDDKLTYGFPYFPLSLLMVLPGYLLGGDIRYADVAAMMLSAGMMCFARPGKWGALAAAIFLLTPRVLYVTDLGWTEPLLMLSFSTMMLCACRFPRALPYALGLYFATKQYAILSLPAVILLVEGPNRLKQMIIMLAKAAAVATTITLPFFLWNPREFFRAVVAWQLVQPFRNDALSYLVWWARKFHPESVNLMRLTRPKWTPPIITPALAVAPAAALAVWRCVRSPAGFAAAITLINFTFFAFNKQAFCNYYYFVIGAACWTVAATKVPFAEKLRSGFEVMPIKPAQAM